jgi:hypothetical protein
MNSRALLAALLLAAAIPSVAETSLHTFPYPTSCLVVTKEGDAVLGTFLGDRYDSVDLEFPGGIALSVHYSDVSRIELGTDIGATHVNPIIRIPDGPDVYVFGEQYYTPDKWLGRYLSLVQALNAAHPEDLQLKEYADEYGKRTRTVQLLCCPIAAAALAGLGYTAYGLATGPDPKKPGLFELRVFGGLGISLAASCLGIAISDNVGGSPQALVQYYNEAYPLR